MIASKQLGTFLHETFDEGVHAMTIGNVWV
jgi:hypothetical protein